MIPYADRYKLTLASIFAFCAATITAGGINLLHISLSLSTIRQLKLKAEVETADAIKRNFNLEIISIFLEVSGTRFLALFFAIR